MKKAMILIILVISNCSFGQDWCAWSFRMKFRLDTKETIRYRYKDLDVFVNDSYNYQFLRKAELQYDAKTGEYSLSIVYGCISCGFPNADLPPELYLKINLENTPSGLPFSSMIPVYFQRSRLFLNTGDNPTIMEADAASGRSGTIDLGTIAIKHFITDNHWKDDIETYDVIEVDAAGSPHYRKQGRYKPRRMNRLVPVEWSKVTTPDPAPRFSLGN